MGGQDKGTVTIFETWNFKKRGEYFPSFKIFDGFRKYSYWVLKKKKMMTRIKKIHKKRLKDHHQAVFISPCKFSATALN